MKYTYLILSFDLLLLLSISPLAGQPEAFTVEPVAVVSLEVIPDSITNFIVVLNEVTGGCNATGSVLPISTPVLRAERLDPSFVELSWREFQRYPGNDWFLERRFEHLANFVIVRELSDKTMREREYLDRNAYEDKTYYRLHGISVEGEHSYSRTVVVGNTTNVKQFAIHPNPASGFTTVSLPGEGEAAVLNVVDGLGRTVQRRIIPANGVNTLSLDVSALRPGSYLLGWTNVMGHRATLRFVRL
ncbi:T9SS type A sorting domain-containing protein [Neolewinella antarctica]|uniref:Secretion system C-terminal sorting domain-containing protein n=1 Tax=Neolewinella antarctica TaxID=442734 RepID=A0ABX0XE42_9BACT|nr:T9SS type A sorting domain-containing protein [Neolewinella antarctica]NJC27164.1 hypothetical protein [Neolewinella antarctica]